MRRGRLLTPCGTRACPKGVIRQSSLRLNSGTEVHHLLGCPSTCALAVLARRRSVDVVRDCLSFLPRPDLLIQIDAPQETLRRRLLDRHARQPMLEVLLELGVDEGLRQATISREIGTCLRQAGWPLIQVNGAQPHDFEKIITRVLDQHDRKTEDVGDAMVKSPSSAGVKRRGSAACLLQDFREDR